MRAVLQSAIATFRGFYPKMSMINRPPSYVDPATGKTDTFCHLANDKLRNIVNGLSQHVSSVRFRTNHLKGKNMLSAELIIRKLGLQPLPDEGGFYLETYRSTIKTDTTSQGVDGKHSASTAIYYMVTPENFSALHRIRQDEVFHFYMGEPVEILMLNENGEHQVVTLGHNIFENQHPQFVIPAGTWQGLRLSNKSSGWALMGTTVAPGFEFSDFELGDRKKLLEQFPDKGDLIDLYIRS